MIDPGRVVVYLSPSLKGAKRDLLRRVAGQAGRVATAPDDLARAAADFIPAAACHIELLPLFRAWRLAHRPFVYFDRGYFRRGESAAAALPRGGGQGFWRWHVNGFQLAAVAPRPPDRWRALAVTPAPWRPASGGAIVVAAPSRSYAAFHGLEGWTAATVAALGRHSSRAIAVRRKEAARPLAEDLRGAHALVTHGSIAAVEAVFLGCPVFVAPGSAAASVGRTDLSLIEDPARPERQPWFNALAYAQFSEAEMLAGAMWAHLPDPFEELAA